MTAWACCTKSDLLISCPVQHWIDSYKYIYQIKSRNCWPTRNRETLKLLFSFPSLSLSLSSPPPPRLVNCSALLCSRIQQCRSLLGMVTVAAWVFLFYPMYMLWRSCMLYVLPLCTCSGGVVCSTLIYMLCMSCMLYVLPLRTCSGVVCGMFYPYVMLWRRVVSCSLPQVIIVT